MGPAEALYSECMLGYSYYSYHPVFRLTHKMGEIEVDEWDRDFDIGQTITAGLEDDLERIMYRYV